MSRRTVDVALVAGGVLLAGLTYRAYRGFDAPSGRLEENHLSPREADITVASAKTYLNSNPEDFNTWSQLAIAYFNKGPDSYPDALNAIDRARSLGANSETLFYYAGVMYDSLGLPDYAFNELSKYLRHHPDDYETQVHVANLLAAQKKYDESYKLYQVLVKKNPQDPTLWFNFAVVCKEKGDLNGASDCFSKVNQLVKQLPEGGLYQEGELERLKGSDEKAMGFYQQELSLHPEYLPALIALEAAQRRKNLWKEARETRVTIAAVKAKLAPPPQKP